MRLARIWMGTLPLAALCATGVALSPAVGAKAKKRPAAVSVSFDPIFTPANADPRLAAAFAKRGTALGDLKFTPAPAKGRPSQVRIAIRAPAKDAPAHALLRATAAEPATALTPTSYNLGVGVGWRRFAVAGDVAKTGDPDLALGERESASVGVSYSLKRFSGQVAVNADRGDGGVAALRKADNYSLDLGGSYNISRRIAVTGGVRYRIDRDRVAPVSDDRRDSQAVYVGTAFKF